MTPSPKQFVSSRRGSVMIMVVALLVLMALIGTAYIANSRMGRATSAEQVESARINQLAEGVQAMATAAMVGDITSDPATWTANRHYRPGQIVRVDLNEENTPPTPVTPPQYFECTVEHVSGDFNLAIEPNDPNEAGQDFWIPAASFTKLRPTSTAQLKFDYKHYDSHLSDPFLSSRVPDLLPNVDFSAPTTVAPGWHGFSWPLLQSDPRVPYKFDVPYVPIDGPTMVPLAYRWMPSPQFPGFFIGQVVMHVVDGVERFYVCTATHATPGVANMPPNTAFWRECEPKQYSALIPTSMVGHNGQVYPAFRFFNRFDDNSGAPPLPGLQDVDQYDGTTSTGASSDNIFVAADADGDGIADAGLWRLPVEPKNGVTFYAGVRIIDHNSALNLNTALSGNYDFEADGDLLPSAVGGNTLLNYRWFSSNIGLAELLRTNNPTPTPLNHSGVGSEFSDLSTYRTQGIAPGVDGVIDDGTDPVTDDPTVTRPDFEFDSLGEAYHIQLGRRVANPGFAQGGTAADAVRFQTLSPADSLSLAYHGELYHPYASATTSELALAPSLQILAPNFQGRFTAYPHDAAYKWYADSYYFEPTDLTGFTVPGEFYGAGAGATFGADVAPLPRPLRALLTTSNPLSTATPAMFEAEDGPSVEPMPPLVTDMTTPTYSYAATVGLPLSHMAPHGNRGSWLPTVTYEIGDVVQHAGIVYTAESQNTNVVPPFPPAVTAEWRPYRYRSTWSDLEPYIEGDFVHYRGEMYRALAAITGGLPPAENPGAWVEVTPNGASPKVSANTATFNELYRAYWSVMADGAGRTPYDDQILSAVLASQDEATNDNFADLLAVPPLAVAKTIPMFRNPYIGMEFADPFPFEPLRRRTLAPFVEQPAQHPARMFRSSLRAVPEPGVLVFAQGVPRLDAYQMLLLRAAIAAVNTEDLRDSDDDVSARMISLKVSMRPDDDMGDPAEIRPANVTVYGSERQPFMTKVYAVGGGWVGVELFNPYPTALALNNYRFATINRDAAGTYIVTGGRPQHLLLTDAGPVEDGGGAAITMTPFERIVIHSGPPPAGVISGVAPVPRTFLMPTLATAAAGTGLELVLLRSRRYDGVASAGLTFDESTAAPGDFVMETAQFAIAAATPARLRELAEMVPVDSYDFTGIPAGTIWHYVRASHTEPVPTAPDPVTLNAWRCVYPGRYNAGVGAGLARHQGTILAAAANPPPFLGGGADATALDEDDDNNRFLTAGGGETEGGNNVLDDPARSSFPVDFVVPYATGTGMNPVHDYTVGAPNPNRYPYGGFARDGDLLHVTYFGAYRVQIDDFDARDDAELLELNSAPIDCAFVEDTDATPEDLNDSEAPDPLENTAGEPANTPARIDDDDDVNGNGLIDTEDVNNNGQSGFPAIGPFVSEESLADLTEFVGRFVPEARDMATPTYGVIDAVAGAVVTDAERSISETGNPVPADLWCEYDLQIVSGVAAGESRRVIGSTPAGGLAIEYGFAIAPAPGDVYRLTRARKAWCTDLFDHISVEAPHDDYFPNYPRHQEWTAALAYPVNAIVDFDGNLYIANAAIAAGVAPPGGAWVLLPRTPIANREGVVPNGPEELSSPVHGKININTASWRVLATLPMVINPNTGLVSNDPTTTTIAGRALPEYLNDNLAKAIVHFRDVDGNPDPEVTIPHGPFKSIYELNKVVDTRPTAPAMPAPPPGGYVEPPGFQNAYQTLDFDPFDTGGADPLDLDDVDGDHAPQNAPGVDSVPPPPTAALPAGGLIYDYVRNDYEERTLVLNRISNMITTRSDSFTVYAVVEGWLNAGTPLAERVSQKRIAFIADRSQVKGLVTPLQQAVQTTPVPAD